MADVKISELSTGSASGDDQVAVVDSGATKKLTLTAIKDWILGLATVNFTGTLQNSGSDVLTDSDTGTTANKIVKLDSNAKLPAVDGSQLTGIAAGVAKNLIINGGFDVWQRGTSFTSLGNQAYSADRWTTGGNNYNNITVSRVSAAVDGFQYAMRMLSTYAGATTLALYQRIEFNGQFYNGQELTFSFWARASKATTMRAHRLYDGVGYVTGYDTVNVTTSWQKFTVTKTISGMTATPSYMRTFFASDTADINNGDWIEVTGVQLESGSTASDFEYRLPAEELALCQRYYQVHDDIHMAAYVDAGYRRAETYVPLPVEMRAAPTRTVLSSGTSSNIRSPANTYSGFVTGVNKHAVVLSMESNGSGYMYIYNRKEELDSEL